MKRLLEIFCGTKSVGKVAEKAGFKVVSIDIDPKYEPTHLTDILKWNYKQYPIGYFDTIWASPPCTEFSKAKSTGLRNLEHATKIVKKTIDIINYLKPKHFIIENPVGLLRHMKVMEPLNQYKHTVSYCKYGTSYQKNTDIWTNKKFKPCLCRKGNRCKNSRLTGTHSITVQKGRNKNYTPGTPNIYDRYKVPHRLVSELLEN